ncbi:MAG: SPOR domain-containing protein [Prevotellaceae bacterium]|jgi:nucleoid DNA-binding protein|nr:SPOR domain-containing protein [Prevotellaceae bacterium]
MPASLSIIGDLLAQLLRVHNRVSLPGLGAFVTEYRPAAIIKNGRGLLPPEKTVVFRISELWNDGLLEKEFAAKSMIAEEEAKKQIAHFVRELDTLLREGKRVEFPDFGTMRITADGDYSFKKDDDVNLLPESFGLLELDVTPLPQKTPPPPVLPAGFPKIEPFTPAPVITPLMPPTPLTPPTPSAPPAPPLYSIPPTPPIPPTPLTPPPVMPEDKPKRKKCCALCWIILALVLLVNGTLIIRSMLAFYARESELNNTLRTTQQTTPPPATTPKVKKETAQPVAIQTSAEMPIPEEPAAAPVKKKKTATNTAPARTQDARKSNAMNLYHIMVGAYANEKEAKTAMQRLQESAGCSCILVNTGGQRPYKISSFRYTTQHEANEILSVFKRTDAEYGSAWVERY